MTLTDELKLLDDKIKANQSQYDFDKEAAKISALSSKELDKYESLTGKDLGYKPGEVEQAKFEYSPLGTVFNKGLEKEHKKEGFLKRLKNIEWRNKEQLEDQRGKKLDAIKKNNQLKVKKKDDKTKDIMCLTEEIDKLNDLYPNAFSSKDIILSKGIENYKNKINYKDLSYKIGFTEQDVIRSHENNFLEKYGMLYDLLNDLLTNKINTNNANIDQLHLVSNLMQGYD